MYVHTKRKMNEVYRRYIALLGIFHHSLNSIKNENFELEIAMDSFRGCEEDLRKLVRNMKHKVMKL